MSKIEVEVLNRQYPQGPQTIWEIEVADISSIRDHIVEGFSVVTSGTFKGSAPLQFTARNTDLDGLGDRWTRAFLYELTDDELSIFEESVWLINPKFIESYDSLPEDKRSIIVRGVETGQSRGLLLSVQE